MKMIIVLAAVVAVAVAASLPEPKDATIIRYSNDNNGAGDYQFGYETSDGITRQERAHLKNVGTKTEALAVEGAISWVGADGQKYMLNYVADENGFQPQGAHLPTA